MSDLGQTLKRQEGTWLKIVPNGKIVSFTARGQQETCWFQNKRLRTNRNNFAATIFLCIQRTVYWSIADIFLMQGTLNNLQEWGSRDHHFRRWSPEWFCSVLQPLFIQSCPSSSSSCCSCSCSYSCSSSSSCSCGLCFCSFPCCLCCGTLQKCLHKWNTKEILSLKHVLPIKLNVIRLWQKSITCGFPVLGTVCCTHWLKLLKTWRLFINLAEWEILEENILYTATLFSPGCAWHSSVSNVSEEPWGGGKYFEHTMCIRTGLAQIFEHCRYKRRRA